MNSALHQSVEAPVEITRRLLGSSAIVSVAPGSPDITVQLDVEGFIRRLLLFDAYVLHSVRLKEIPELVRTFGYEGTLTLLGSGALEIRCECAQYCEGFSNPPCPPLTFQFGVIEAHVRDQYVIDNLSEVNRTPGLTSHELMKLQSAVMNAVRQPDNREMFSSVVAPAVENDALRNIPLLKTAVRLVLAKTKGIKATEFDLRLHKIADDRYQAETNLPEKLTLSIEDVHNAVKQGVLGLAGVNQRFGEMRAHRALSGFTEEELPFCVAKLDSLAEAVGSHRQEGRFRRVMSITGLPSFGKDVDIARLLEIRNTPEAREFRSWLSDIDRLTDAEIKELVAGLNAKIGRAVQTSTGKLLRFLITTAIGVGSPPAGAGAGLLDQFLWDRFFRRSGVAAFVHELYPSIFKPHS